MQKVIGKRVMCIYPWRADEELKTASGIIIPDSQKEKPNNLVVTLSGIDGVNVGDRVVFNKYHGTTIEVENQEFLFLKEEEILGVL